MKIKKHKNGNEYLYSGGLWIRNYTRSAPPIDINELTSVSDRCILLQNQSKNNLFGLMNFDANNILHQNICIVSDGYEFDKKQKLLNELPTNVVVIGVNRSLVKWNINNNRKMNYYVVNNPYEAALSFLPEHNYFPNCICSIRTYPEFLERYRGTKMKYYPAFEESFAQTAKDALFFIDDYRNPVCAAIGLAYKMKASKILLFCCDDAFAGSRPGSVSLNNGLHIYPQHKIVHNLIEGYSYWFNSQKTKKVKIGTHSNCPESKCIQYISDNKVNEFFVNS